MQRKSIVKQPPVEWVVEDSKERGFKASIRSALDSHVDKVHSVFFKHLPRAEKHIRKKVERHPFFLEFRAFKRRSAFVYFLIISGAIILYWRGLWLLYDLLFDSVLREYSYTSAFISIALGLLIIIGTRQTIKSLF